MPNPSSHCISATAISPLGNRKSTKAARESWAGAQEAALRAVEHGWATPSPDDLRVDPLTPGSKLWEWVQPVMGAGGHIVGAPTPTQEEEETVLRMGLELVRRLREGERFVTKRPEEAIPVLAVLALLDHQDELRAALQPVMAYASMPQVEVDHGEDYESRFVGRLRYPGAVAALEHFGLKPSQIPSWKQIKRSTSTGIPISNNMARYIRRLMVSQFPKKHRIWRIATLRDQCCKPIDSNKHPVRAYVEYCWRLRPSSISVSLPKWPPAAVVRALEGMGDGDASGCDVATYRMLIVDKFRLFQQWVQLQHGSNSGPTTWSDTLSHLASSINRDVDQYNERVGRIDLMHATSFVPGDLAPEMYQRGCTATGYFFNGRGMCYAYSANWRRDAYSAYLQRRLPPAVNALDPVDHDRLAECVSEELATLGGQELLRQLTKADVSELEFTTFLRQYYFSGAFLIINTS